MPPDMARVCPGCEEPAPPALLRGIDQFNRGEFFAQHETLEVLWRSEARPVRALYQGILQIGVAFHHLDRDNVHGVVTMLERGLGHLRRLPRRCQGVDVAALMTAAEIVLDAVAGLEPEGLRDLDRSLLPTIRVERRAVRPRP